MIFKKKPKNLKIKIRKVMVFGTFDILHPGHFNFFEQAKRFGDFLIVIVARDSTVFKIKGQKPFHSEKQRLRGVKKIDIVDKAVLGHKMHRYKVILEQKPNIICLGYDQNITKTQLEKQLKKIGVGKIKILRLKAYHPKKYKSSLIKGFKPCVICARSEIQKLRF